MRLLQRVLIGLTSRLGCESRYLKGGTTRRIKPYLGLWLEAKKMKEAGFDGVLTKPINMKGFVQFVADVFSAKTAK